MTRGPETPQRTPDSIVNRIDTNTLNPEGTPTERLGIDMVNYTPAFKSQKGNPEFESLDSSESDCEEAPSDSAPTIIARTTGNEWSMDLSNRLLIQIRVIIDGDDWTFSPVDHHTLFSTHGDSARSDSAA